MLVTIGLLLFGYNGMIVRAVLVAGIAVFLMHRVRPIAVSPAWHNDSLFLLLRTGVPIFAMDYILTCSATLDKVALLKYGGVEQVGLYALAMNAGSAFQALPQSIAHYVYPRMSHHYGRTHNPRILWDMAWKTTLVVIGSMIPIAIVGWVLLPMGVMFLFPKYVLGTYAAKIALVGSVANGATTGANALVSLKAWSHLVAYQLGCSLLFVACPFLGIRFSSSPLNGVAYGMLAANLMGAFLALTITYAATHRPSEAVA